MRIAGGGYCRSEPDNRKAFRSRFPTGIHQRPHSARSYLRFALLFRGSC
jgi:hypothetical protein